MGMYAAPASTMYATPSTAAFAAPTYSPAAVMMPGTATMAPMTTSVLPTSQFVGLPSAQSMVAYPSYPGMLPQPYMPSFQAGMVVPTMANMGATPGAATDTPGHAMTGTETGTSAVPNVGETAVKAA